MWDRLYIALNKSGLSAAAINNDVDLAAVRTCWDHRSVMDTDRAIAVWMAMSCGAGAIRVNILTWFFQSPRFPLGAVKSHIADLGLNPTRTFDNVFLKWQLPVTVELLTAVISIRAPFQDTETLLSTLLRTGGVALAEIALHNEYQLQFPTCLSTMFHDFCPHINDDFIDRCTTHGVDTSLVRPVLAVHIRNLQLLEISLPALEAPGHHVGSIVELMSLAVENSWAEGVLQIGRRYRWILRPERGTLQTALRSPNRGCWDALLGLGQNWKDAAFTVAWDEQNFREVEALVRNGALIWRWPLPGVKPVIIFVSDDSFCHIKGIHPHVWLDQLRRSLDNTSFEERPLWQRSLSERLLIYVAALVDQQVAESVVPDVIQWVGRWKSFLQWWHPKASGRFHRDLMQNTVELAAVDLPKVWRQAEKVAARIRSWAGVPGPSNTVLDLITMMSVTQVVGSTASWLQSSE
jgi:hypothetical protein